MTQAVPAALRAPGDAIERVLVPLDRARVRVLRAMMPISSRLVGERELRVAAVGVSAVLLALSLSLIAPLWLLALGPIVLGVPHLLADLRYCVVRPGWHRERALWVTAGLPLLAMACGAPLEYGLLGVAASAIWCPVDRGAGLRRAAVVGGALALAAGVRAIGSTADLIFAHAHNFVAVALWAAWRARTTGRHVWVLAAFVLASVGLSLGLGDFAWSSALAAGLPEGLDARTHLATLAPGVDGPWGLRLVLLYCFAQSVHYGVWLRLIPEDDRGQPTPRTFRASYRALSAELGPWVLGLFTLGAAAVALWACLDLAEARAGYLRVARCHGSLELIAAGLLIVSGRRSARARPT
ncbi:hypothetical protein ENSA5_08530 [Enhygromyxa salina]|uniref:Uncharacterized protein n=1 Tax=Enhygromyxa salina TaxID=215803 RepID=A0A2S9YGW0_9BACT|nr:hypothetical protein [Enhygromyxa salina]PRQ04344.1 hypothetical protein ENSA5_08530 [Enhygromyxa salina]